MLSTIRTMSLAGLVGLGTMLGAGATPAKAQLVVSTPGFALGVGAPIAPVYPGVGVYPGVVPTYGAYPVRPYPYVYGRAFYGPRPFGPYYGPHWRGGYRRW